MELSLKLIEQFTDMKNEDVSVLRAGLSFFVRYKTRAHQIFLFVFLSQLSRFILPVIHGFIEFQNCSIKSRTFDFILISRRSCYRAGMISFNPRELRCRKYSSRALSRVGVRYYIRGLDVEGHPANYVETEQIIQYNGETTSFVQASVQIPYD